MPKPPTIDHDPNEPPRRAYNDWWLFPAGFAMVAALWLWFFTFETPHWVSVGIGALTGMMFAFWACETFPGPYKSPPGDRPTDTRRDL